MAVSAESLQRPVSADRSGISRELRWPVKPVRLEIRARISLGLGLFCILSRIRLRFELVYPLVVIVAPPIVARLTTSFLERECPGWLLACRHGLQVRGRVRVYSPG